MGKSETPKFNFCSSFCGGKAEDKGKAIAIPDSLKKRKITTYMPPSKSIIMGCPIRAALAPTDINPDQSPTNLADIVFTTTTGDKRDVDFTIPSSELPITVAEEVELESHLTTKETLGPNNSKFDHSEALMTRSMAGSLGFIASKKALFKLCYFVVENHPEFDFFGFIVDFNVFTPPTPDEDDNSSAPMNNVSNMEVDPSETADRVGRDV
ncbi:hypothetical protein NE237_031201 [Protea cynaroides]|uniref:Uncharacterized protein n=1 Tax=Protea cynaroides TaxID=273540 RepID=A0A9Q0L1S5_9MAGN|nr:hypothetical protein NE237_031201 [Protea cynaroides]